MLTQGEQRRADGDAIENEFVPVCGATIQQCGRECADANFGVVRQVQ